MRRVMTVVRPVCGCLAGVTGAIYIIGRLVTDRTHVTQYLFWLPSFLFLAALFVLTVVAWVAQDRRRRGRERARQRWAWQLGLVLFATVFAHVALVEWHLPRFVAPVAPPTNNQKLQIMHWNLTYTPPYRWDRYITAAQRAPRPDVMILSNPTMRNDLDQMAEALGPDFVAARCGIFAVFTRLPIIARGSASLRVPAMHSGPASPPGMTQPDESTGPKTEYLPEWSPIPRTGSNIYDPGHAMYVRIDATAVIGREIVIWGVDLPSQPRAWRWESAWSAANQLEALMGAKGVSPGRFPPPDMIVGDCNTPRGSASLDFIANGFQHAFDQAGRGYVATWPRRRPLFHIDHVFVGPSLRATRYTVMDLGISEHQAQFVDVTHAH